MHLELSTCLDNSNGYNVLKNQMPKFTLFPNFEKDFERAKMFVGLVF